MKKINKFFLILTVFFIGIPSVFSVEPSMSSDVSSYPGADIVPPGSIGSYINTGYRIYIVDRKEGKLLAGSKVVDMAQPRANVSTISFYKTSGKYTKVAFLNQASRAKDPVKITFLDEDTLKKYNSNDTVYMANYAGVPFPTNWGNTSLGQDPVNAFHEKLKEIKSKDGESTAFIDFIFENIYNACDVKDTKCKEDKIKMLSKFESINGKEVPDYYLVYEPLIFYKIFDGGYYALTATESAMIFNETNFPKWWNGVTVRPEPKYHEFAPDHFNNVLNYPSCTTELNNALEDLLLGRSGAAAALETWNTRCEKTLKWLLDYQIFGRNPRFAVHKNSYKIGNVNYSAYVPDGSENKDYPNRFTVEQIVGYAGSSRGLGIGFVSMAWSETETCPPTFESTKLFLTDKNCCTKFDGYFAENKINPSELNSIKIEHAKYCPQTCPMSNKTEILNTISGMSSDKKCCTHDNVKKWFDDTYNKNFDKDYNAYLDAKNAACDPVNQDPQVCIYKINTKYPNTCSTDTTGYVSDIDNWNCIFKSQSLGGSNFSNHYDEFSNRYCKIFCRQEIKYEYPSASFTMEAGKHFTIGINSYGATSWNPVEMMATATCRVDDNQINVSLFETDWTNANQRVIAAWDELQKEIAREKSVLNAQTVSNSNTCNCTNKAGGVSCCQWGTYTCVPKFGCFFTCRAYNTTSRYTLYKPVSSVYDKIDYKQGEFCSDTQTWPKFNVSNYRQNYYQELNSRDNLLTSLKQCTEFKYTHSFNPKLSIDYEEDRYGGNFPLTGNIKDNYNTDYLNGTIGQIRAELCNTEGKTCSRTTVSYPTYKNILHTSIRSIDYSLSGTVYKYVDKISSVSAHNSTGFNQYTMIGYNNLPIDFTRYSGKYDLNIRYGDFGAGNKFNEFISTGKAGTPRCDGYPNCIYKCQYGVVNKILCDPKTEVCDSSTDPDGDGLKGLNILFRPIALSNPFPGLDGKGRESGSNWQGSITRITKNRGVEASEIYIKREPMYEITLDSKTLRAIREDNKKSNYSDFNLTCKTGTGKECVSDFLTRLSKTSGLKINKCARDAANKWADTCSYQ